MIPGACPDCGGKRPLPDYLADADTRAALAAALSLPAPLARLIVSYLDLHSPPGRAVHMPKLRRLLQELTDLISAGSVTRSHETRPAPLAAWQHGLEQLIAQRDAGTLSLPLKGHGYLCEIVHRHAGHHASRQQASTKPLHPSHRPFTPADEAHENERARVARSMPAPADAGTDQYQVPHAIGRHLAGLKAALSGRAPPEGTPSNAAPDAQPAAAASQPSPSPPPTDPEP